MKKHDFIAQLNQALAPINAQAREEIIADINEHFAEGAAHGQTEEEICINLGQPSQIAEQVLEEYKAYKAQHNHDFTDIGDIVSSAMDAADIEDILSSALQTASYAVREAAKEASRASRDAAKEAAKAAREASRHARDTAREAARTAREAARELEKTDMDVYMHYKTAQQPNSQWGEAHIHKPGWATRIRGGFDIDIDQAFAGVTGMDVILSLANIKVVPMPTGDTQANEVRVTVKGKSRYSNFELENKNGTLYIRQREPFFKFEIFGFNSSLEVTIYVPASYCGDIKLLSNVGNLSIVGISGNLRLNTTAGNITVEGHSADRAHLRSSAGNINLTNCSVTDINAKSSAGNVKVKGRDVADLTLRSSAGDVDVNVNTLGGETNLATSAGGVYIKALDVQGNITAKSSAGNVKVYLPMDVNCRIHVSKPSIGSLSNNLAGNPNSPYTLRAYTSVGSIKLEPYRQPEPPHHN
ncbi:MAG: DUF4097 family beta strand repeat-containing protein [Defluviitaleaceae bacterium]|nr:DUF4097 family beta strand repeat-containing protein [Defluviitaleaceae bacterium]